MTLRSRTGTVFYAVTVLVLAACSSTRNEGHRLGADRFDGAYTENTLESFKATLSDDFSKFKQFKYYELDIRETADAELVLYHDRYFSRRLLSESTDNKRVLALSGLSVWNRYRVRNQYFDTIRKLELKNGEQIPTLEEFLRVAEKYKVKERILVEMKEPLSRYGMEQLFYLLSLYRFELSLSVLMYPHVFRCIKKEHSDIIEALYNKQIYVFEVGKPKNRKYIFKLERG